MAEEECEATPGAGSRPTTQQQSRGRLVLQVDNFVLANKVVVVSVFEVHSTPSSSLGSASRPSSSVESLLAEVQPTDDGVRTLASVTGFYVTAIDEIENEYSLYISKQKAVYLHRAEHDVRNTSASASSYASEQVSADGMAASIIAHLDIIGNRHRDIGKLTCREPQVYVTKKARVVPAKGASARQKNVHVPTRRQDQRAARSLLTAVKARAAIASGHKVSIFGAPDLANGNEELTPRTRKARKSSEYRLLSRMAVADSKTIWKSELEAIHDDPSYRAMMDGVQQKRESAQVQLGTGTDAATSDDGDRTASLSTMKRAMPEKKAKHKELQERRDKGREARLRITRATSSSAINELASEANNATNAEDSSRELRTATFEEVGGQPGSLKRLPTLGGSSRQSLLSKGDSAASLSIQPPLLVGNSFSRQSLALEQSPEPEQFLRKRSDAAERRVLKVESVFNEIPGMEIEITTERPKGHGSLLGSPRLDDVMRLEKHRMQENARRSSLVRDENGNLGRRPSIDRVALRRQSQMKSPRLNGALSASPSAPELQRPDSVPAESELVIRTASHLLLPATPRSARGEPSPLSLPVDPHEMVDARWQGGGETASTASDGESSAELFMTTRRFTATKAKPTCVPTPESTENQVEVVGGTNQPPDTKGLQIADHDHLRASESPRKPGLLQEPNASGSHSSPRSARNQQQNAVIEIDEESVETVEEARGGEEILHNAVEQEAEDTSRHQEQCQEGDDSVLDAQSSDETLANQQSERDRVTSLRLLTPRQACWTEKSPQQESSASPWVLPPIVLPAVTVRREALSGLSPTPGESPQNDALGAPKSDRVDELNNRSSDNVQPPESVVAHRRLENQQAPTDTSSGVAEAASVLSCEDVHSLSADRGTGLSRNSRQIDSKPGERTLSSKDTKSKRDESEMREQVVAATEAAAADPMDSGAAKVQVDSCKKRSAKAVPLLQTSPHYHKKWGRWFNSRLVDKISCLQLEELVLQNPSSEKHLVKLGIRYARWSGTSLAAIQLLEHASLLHENAPRTREYWNSMGNAHLNIFLRNRKFLPISKIHLDKCLQAFSRAFAYMESMADPLLLLRYSICLFWRSGDENLEKADDVLRELFTKFASFCDKDRLNLLFLRFQTLSRLHMHREAAECMEAAIELHTASPCDVTDSNSRAPFPYDTTDYQMMLMHCQQSNGDFALATATFSTILKSKGIMQEDNLNDEQNLQLWLSLAEKCFGHEEYPLALEFYSIALNFARDSHVLANIHYSRGLCYEAVHESAKCVAEYKRARNVNRHVTALVAITDLRGVYEEQFSVLLKKPIRQVIDEVRLTLYDKAVKQLQRMFRRKQMKQGRSGDSTTSKAPVRSPSFSVADSRARRRNSVLGQQHASTPKMELVSSVPQKPVDGCDAGVNLGTRGFANTNTQDPEHSSQHQRFLVRQRAAVEKIRAIQVDSRFHPTACGAATSAPSSSSKVAKKIKSMPSETLAHTSGLLSPVRPELRRKQSMEAFNKVLCVCWLPGWHRECVVADCVSVLTSLSSGMSPRQCHVWSTGTKFLQSPLICSSRDLC